MNTTQRRTHILDYLKQADRPLSATALARRLSVSRQIIVGDVALLERPRPGLSRTVACLHSGADMERELTLMVDQGCTVENVIVEHPVYGQITGPLDLSSRYDISEFLRKVEEHAARPLSLLTGGIHLHTLRCPGEDAFQRAAAALDEAGFLVR